MSDIDTGKLTPEQKQALAQVEAALAGQESFSPKRHIRLVKYFVVIVMALLVLTAMYMLMRAQEPL